MIALPLEDYDGIKPKEEIDRENTLYCPTCDRYVDKDMADHKTDEVIPSKIHYTCRECDSPLENLSAINDKNTEKGLDDVVENKPADDRDEHERDMQQGAFSHEKTRT